MRLDDFALYLPVRATAWPRDVAINRGCSEELAEKAHKFYLETSCMSSFFRRLFGYMNTKNCQKINVECVPEVIGHEIINLLGFCFVQVRVDFDYDDFVKLADLDKKKTALDLLMTGIRKVAANQNWDME